MLIHLLFDPRALEQASLQRVSLDAPASLHDGTAVLRPTMSPVRKHCSVPLRVDRPPFNDC